MHHDAFVRFIKDVGDTRADVREQPNLAKDKIQHKLATREVMRSQDFQESLQNPKCDTAVGGPPGGNGKRCGRQ